MKPRIIYLHGNQTTHWSFAWAGWLRQELGNLGFETWFETMPDSIIARSEFWLPFLEDQVKARKNDVVVGWSSGAEAAMRYAERHQLRGSALVSPCYTDLGDAMEKQSGYYNKPWEWDAIRANQGEIAVFYGDNDPYIPQEEFAFIAKQLQAAEHPVHAAEHFIEQNTFPELLAYLKQTY